MRQVYCAVGHKHYEDEECPQCVVKGDPVAVWENPDQHTTEAIKRLPRYDPLMQEAEDRLARRIGREAARQMIDEEENR